MDDGDKSSLVALYEGRYAAMGDDIQTLGWRSREEQYLRFQILSDIADLSNCSVCDIGCGFGDLKDYLSARFSNLSYTGIDISPSLIAEAARRHPDSRFQCVDILRETLEERFDYLLLSGALNFRMSDNDAVTKQMTERMWNLAHRGIALNFLSTYVNYQKPENYHHSPEQIFSFARSLTRWVTLRHDYPLWEFTIYLCREPRSQAESA